MNNIELHLFLMNIFHIIIWLFVFIFGMLNITISKINLFFILPLIYIAQSIFNFHPLLLYDINLIEKNIKYLDKSNKNCKISKIEKIDIEKLAILKNISYEDAYLYFCILRKYQTKLIIPKIWYDIRNYFDKSFRNPLDASGMITLGYIINTFSYFLLSK